MGEINYNIPQNSEDYKGQFIVFFSHEENPEVLFSSYIAEEAYKKAEGIFKDKNIKPTVQLVQNSDNNLAQAMSVKRLHSRSA